jgi:hypothetical protein
MSLSSSTNCKCRYLLCAGLQIKLLHITNANPKARDDSLLLPCEYCLWTVPRHPRNCDVAVDVYHSFQTRISRLPVLPMAHLGRGFMLICHYPLFIQRTTFRSLALKIKPDSAPQILFVNSVRIQWQSVKSCDAILPTIPFTFRQCHLNYWHDSYGEI